MPAAPPPVNRPLTLVPFHVNAFTWNFGLAMTFLLVPLFAHELGMSGVEIGSLISLPVLFQLGLNLLGGAYADRIGAKLTSAFASLCTVAAAITFATSASFAGLLAGQFLMIVSRAAFWPSNWSLASELPGDRSRNMGWLNAITNAGQIAGIAATGMVIAQFGFRAGFWVMAAICLASLFASLLVAHRPVEHAARPALFSTYRALLRRRSIYFAMSCSCISALPFSLSASFYPILLIEQGFASDAAGWLLSLRAVGSIVAGIAIAGLVRRATDPMPPFLSAILSAVSVGLAALFSHPLWVGLCLVGLGIGAGVMMVYFQVVIIAISPPGQRGSAMALGGLGFGLSNFFTPVIAGALTDIYGIHTAFYALGAIAFVSGLCLMPMHRWAFGNQPR